MLPDAEAIFLALPLALASGVGLLLLIPALVAIAYRMPDEEKFLAANLPGYPAYRAKTRYRRVPYVW